MPALKKYLPKSFKTGIKFILAGTGMAFEHVPRSARIFKDPQHQVFFGYYDITPFRADNKLLLACHAPGDNSSPHDTGAPLDFGYYDLGEDQPVFQKFGTTETWNWQQGCRLQWLTSETVIYNTLVEGAYGSVIQNVQNGKILKSLPQPVYSVHGHHALTLDFSKLHTRRRGYGYNTLPSPKRQDDILLMDMQSGAVKIALMMKEAQSFNAHEDMANADHYFNHLFFSPDGSHFMVTHLWVTAAGRRRSRILIRNIDGGEIICPNNTGHTSHYCWFGNQSVLIFHSVSGDQGHYILYDLASGKQDIIAGQYFNEDGHPSLTDKIMITDTYPDFFGLQRLFVFDRTQNAARTLAKLHSPQQFKGELRCDLHPRLDHTNNLVCVDAVRDGRRAMVLLQLN